MAFLRNCWYLAAYANEIPAGGTLDRTIVGERIVFYRDAAGAAVALGGVCPHRFASLATGAVHGDDIECPYHGLRFGPDGVCTYNPHGNGKIPVTARVRAYPAIEHRERVWLWMGDPDRADATRLPPLDFLASPKYKTLCGMTRIDANYLLALDNLLDLSHTQFIHKEFLASDHLRGTMDVRDVGDDVAVDVWIPAGKVPPNYQQFYAPDQPVDNWTDTRWAAPATVFIDFGVTEVGASREAGHHSIGLHIVTPETASTSHYFYANSRSFAHDDPDVDRRRANFQRVAFEQQDRPVIEDCFRNMGTDDLFSLHPVLLSSDAGAIRMRRRLEKLITDEA